MKENICFKSLKIYSHPRSGSNYLAELVDLNIFHTGDYDSIYGGHEILNNSELDTTILYVYIKRQFPEVAKSLFKMRDRFGLDVNDFSQYLDSPYRRIYNGRLKSTVQIKWQGKASLESKSASRQFASVDMLPEEYHKYHIEQWERLEKENENVLVISYEELTENFEKELIRICNKLNLHIDEFKDVEKRVGFDIVAPEHKITSQNIYNLLVSMFRKIKTFLKFSR